MVVVVVNNNDDKTSNRSFLVPARRRRRLVHFIILSFSSRFVQHICRRLVILRRLDHSMEPEEVVSAF